MGYRKMPKREPVPKRTLKDLATPIHIYMKNGTKTSFAIPCWYKEIDPLRHSHHCREWHDYIGHPEPRKKDNSCQHWLHQDHICGYYGKPHCNGRKCTHYVDFDNLVPIHLLKEGYDNIYVNYDYPEVSITGYIDQDEDWIVRLELQANSDSAVSADIDVPFTVTIGSVERELLTEGIVHIRHGNTY